MQRQTMEYKAKNEPIKWPSERIPPGGLFHSPKIEYSKETADLMDLLMKESKMTMLMRKQISEHMKNGEPLPKPEPPRINTSGDPDAEAHAILLRARNAKRKSLRAIMASGVYDIQRYRPPIDDRIPSDKAKKMLQENMSGMPHSEHNLKAKRRPIAETDLDITPEDMIKELLDQINERAEWLTEMEELGEGKKYRSEVQQQIAQRLRHIKALETKSRMQKEGVRYIDI